ncbi:hypothetical protein [Actinocorallia longicatena]|uniref:Cu-Zn family superoxide dismutase n=1 Tax=Actinocorallia longicatena TaxID=111803 RepID=A0ABP6QMI9_9ACTN
MFSKITGRALATTALAGAAVLTAGTSAQACGRTVEGPGHVYDHVFDGTRLTITVRSGRDGTAIRMRLWNLPESARGRSFGAHVHVKPCTDDPAAAGPHYQNPAGTTLEEKEIWLDFTVDARGRARSKTFRPWTIPAGAAGSVVVHAEATDPGTGTAGGRALCTSVPFGT